MGTSKMQTIQPGWSQQSSPQDIGSWTSRVWQVWVLMGCSRPRQGAKNRSGQRSPDTGNRARWSKPGLGAVAQGLRDREWGHREVRTLHSVHRTLNFASPKFCNSGPFGVSGHRPAQRTLSRHSQGVCRVQRVTLNTQQVGPCSHGLCSPPSYWAQSSASLGSLPVPLTQGIMPTGKPCPSKH